ncbi:MAG: hypothetical protein ACPG8W_03235 [Candidatus Promineifilaceae bacterium]
MLDPGRHLAEAIYFLQYTIAQIFWTINRSLLAIAIITESIDAWITNNVAYFVGLLVNALSAPLGGMLILALTALGFWYALSNIVQIEKWVEPSKLLTYGLLTLFFFSSPVLIINQMESLRTTLNAGINQALLDDAAGDIFTTGMNGTDVGLPSSIPDTNSDGVIGSFDLVSAFMAVGNLDELDSNEFPVDFESRYFPFGDPSTINLSDEADRELAKASANEGIERLLFALIAVPTAIAEHFLRLSLTGTAMLLYAGAPIAMLFAFFVYTQAFLGAYLRQFLNLLIETFISVIIVAILLGLLIAAAQQGFALYIGASIIVVIFLIWRIMSALRLASRALDLFGGGMVTGGAGGMVLANMGQRVVAGAVGLTGAVATGGASLAAGGAMMASAAAIRADAHTGGAYLRTDPTKADGRVRQLQTIAGYAFGRNETTRRLIVTSHNARILTRNLRDGDSQDHTPNTLDYLRTGATMSGFGSSPWLAMRLSPSLRTAYDQMGGSSGDSRHSRGLSRDANGAPVERVRPMPPQETETNQPTNSAESTPINSSSSPHNTDDPITVTPSSSRATTNHNSETVDTEPTPSQSVPIPRPQSGRNIVRLETTSPERIDAVNQTIQQLASGDLARTQAAHETVAQFAGDENASRLTSAVQRHSADAVQTAITATARLVDQYRHQGLDSSQILDVFQSGQATEDLRTVLESPLSDSELATVADVTLLPRRRVSRANLVTTIAEQAQNVDANEQTVAASLGSPVGFGGQTGNVRGVLAGAKALRLSSADMQQLTELIDQDQNDAAHAVLTQRGIPTTQADMMLTDIAALPNVITLPQTTSPHTEPTDAPN